jgi:hypothetical protein
MMMESRHEQKEGNGMSGQGAMMEMMKLWKQSWESYLKTLEAFQEQGEKMAELMLGQNPFLPEEAKKLFQEWVSHSQGMQKMYLDMVQENIKRMEEILGQKS